MRLTDYEGAYCFMRCVEEDGYEDKIRENCKLYKVCFERKMYDKLKHYEDLEEQLMESAEIDIDSMVGEFMHYYQMKKENRLIEVIRCSNCKRHENSSTTEGFGWCDVYECMTADDGYCSRAVDKLAELKGGVNHDDV